MIPLAVPDVGEAEAALLQECIRSGWVSSVGPFVEAFEAAVAGATGGEKAVALSSGTAALQLGLTVAGVRPGDLVAMPSWTFVATANAVSHCGASPWLFDVDGTTWNLAAEELAAIVRRVTLVQGGRRIHRASGRRVAAILPVMMLGSGAGLAALREVADRLELPLVLDAACGLGAGIEGCPIAEYADIAALSFNGNKTVTAGGGGALVGRRGAWLDRARHLSTQARTGRGYDHDAIGFNHRLTNLQAAVGLAQMERWPELVRRKRVIRAAYDAALAGIPGFRALPDPGGACWLSGLVVDDGAAIAPEALIGALEARGVGARPFWKPVHLQAPYAEVTRTSMTRCEDLWQRVVTLPCSSHLTAEDRERVVSAVREASALPARERGR